MDDLNDMYKDPRYKQMLLEDEKKIKDFLFNEVNNRGTKEEIKKLVLDELKQTDSDERIGIIEELEKQGLLDKELSDDLKLSKQFQGKNKIKPVHSYFIGDISAVVFISNGKIAVSNKNDNLMKIYQIDAFNQFEGFSKDPICVMKNDSLVHCICWINSTNNLLICGCENGTIEIWKHNPDLGELMKIKTLVKTKDVSIICLTTIPGGDGFTSLNVKGELLLWSCKTFKSRKKIISNPEEKNIICMFTKDSKFIGVKNEIFEKHSTGKILRTLKGHDEEIINLLISPNSNYLISGTFHTIKVWNLKTNDCIQTIPMLKEFDTYATYLFIKEKHLITIYEDEGGISIFTLL